MRHRHAILLAVGLVVGACGGKPTGEDCKKFADHYIALMSADGFDPEGTRTIADGMKPKLIADCEKAERASIECSLKAKTMEEVRLCESDDEPQPK